MKRILVLVLLMSTLTGCKKTIENIKQNLVVKVMTDGEWKISSFTEDGAQLGADYSDYAFKFNENETMEARKSGTLQSSGTWHGDANALTISTLFNGVENPLLRTNGTWKIDNTTETTVNATQVGGNASRTMKLIKL